MRAQAAARVEQGIAHHIQNTAHNIFLKATLFCSPTVQSSMNKSNKSLGSDKLRQGTPVNFTPRRVLVLVSRALDSPPGWDRAHCPLPVAG